MDKLKLAAVVVGAVLAVALVVTCCIRRRKAVLPPPSPTPSGPGTDNELAFKHVVLNDGK